MNETIVVKIKLKENFMKKKKATKQDRIMAVLEDGNWWSTGDISRMPQVDSTSSSVSAVLRMKSTEEDSVLERDDSTTPILYRLKSDLKEEIEEVEDDFLAGLEIDEMHEPIAAPDIVVEVIKKLALTDEQILSVSAKLIALVIDSNN